MTAAALGGALQPLRDSSGLLDDTAVLRLRLAEDGYLFLPGFHTRAAVMGARRELLEYILLHKFVCICATHLTAI